MESTLSSRDRVRQRSDFLRIQGQGDRVPGRYLTLFVLPNDLEVTRLGIIATRRLGGATRRNRSKRMIREIFRLNKGEHEGFNWDIIVLPRPGFSDKTFDVLQADYLNTLRRYARSK